MMPKKTYSLTIVVADDEEVLFAATVTDRRNGKDAEMEQVVSPNVNLLELQKLFLEVANSQEHLYYMNRVRTLSREARQGIKRAVEESDDNLTAPF